VEETGLYRVECRVIMDVVTTVLLLGRPATLQDWVQCIPARSVVFQVAFQKIKDQDI
jgi:hypothetical protein